jgi:hypothetical protein
MSVTEFDPNYANTGVDKIVSLILPDAATSIAAGAYNYSTNSEETAFKNFSSLTSVSGAGIQTVGDQAFRHCAGLTSVSLPAVTSIGREAFFCTGLTSLSIPASLLSIHAQAFNGCTNLTSISVSPYNPNYSASADGKMLLNRNGTILLSYPSASGEITLNGITNIGDRAFSKCFNLTSLSLPAVTSIGNMAFDYCDGLTSVSLPASLLSIGSQPFISCVNLRSITVDPGNPNYKAEDGKLLTKDGTTLIAYPSASGSITLNGIITIANGAFNGCTGLTEVSLPEAVSIGNNAFYNCKEALTTVNLPVATSIGSQAFRSTGPQAITLGATAPTVGTNTFNSVNAAKTVTVKVPSGAAGYGSSPTDTTTNNWGNAFRGMGWDGASYGSGTVNSNISLTIEYTP